MNTEQNLTKCSAVINCELFWLRLICFVRMQNFVVSLKCIWQSWASHSQCFVGLFFYSKVVSTQGVNVRPTLIFMSVSAMNEAEVFFYRRHYNIFNTFVKIFPSLIVYLLHLNVLIEIMELEYRNVLLHLKSQRQIHCCGSY